MSAALLRIHGQRPIKRIKGANKWDDRFYVEQIPKYNMMKDIHAASYVGWFIRRKKVLVTPGKIRRTKSRASFSHLSRPRSKREIPVPPVGFDKLQQVQQTYMRIADFKNIPIELSQQIIFAIKGFSPELKEKVLSREIDAIKHDKSVTQETLARIQDRESIRDKIKEILVQSLQINKKLMYNLLQDYREATLSVVEHIQLWREHLARIQKSEKSSMPFQWQGRNYLLKLRSDMGFLLQSEIVDMYEFSKSPDPLLIYPAAVHLRNPHLHWKKENLIIPVAIFNRCIAAKYVIQKEYKMNNKKFKRSKKVYSHPWWEDTNEMMSQTMYNESRYSSVLEQMDQSQEPDDYVSMYHQLEPQDTKQPIKVSFKAINGSREEALENISNYLDNVETTIKDTQLGIGDLLNLTSYSGWIWLYKDDSSRTSPFGVLVYHIDISSIMFRRIVIDHISCLNFDEFEQCLDAATKMLFDLYPAQEIRLGLLHVEDSDGKLVVYENVRQAVERVGFKWKNLTNASENRRVLIMGIRRTEDTHANTPNIKYFSEVLTIRVGIVLGITEEQQEASDTGSDFSGTGLFNLALALRHVDPDHKSFQPDTPLDYLLGCMPEEFTAPATKIIQHFDLELATEHMVKDGVSMKFDDSSDEFIVSYTSLGLKWPEYSWVNIDNQHFIRVVADISVAQKGEHTLYLIPTDDEFTCFIITPPTSSYDVLASMEVINTIDNLAFPWASLESCDSVSTLNGQNLGSGYVASVQQYLRLEVTSMDPLVGSLDLECEHIIHTPYTFGLFCRKLDEVPFIMTTINEFN